MLWLLSSFKLELLNSRMDLEIKLTHLLQDFELPGRTQLKKAFTAATKRRLRKRSRAKGNLLDEPSAVKEECVVVLSFVRIFFSLHCTCSGGGVSAPHCLDRLFPLTQNKTLSVGQCSGGPTVYCASAGYFAFTTDMFFYNYFFFFET